MIEQIIEEMKELMWQAEKDIQLSYTSDEANHYGGLHDAYEKSIEIAEKYKADKCKWKYIEANCFYAKISCKMPKNIMNIRYMRKYKFCPYCGKEIEVDE